MDRRLEVRSQGSGWLPLSRILSFGLLLVALCPRQPNAQDGAIQSLEEPKSVLSRVLSLQSTEISSAITSIKQCNPQCARLLWFGLSTAGKKSESAGDLSRALFLYKCSAEAARQAGDEGSLADAMNRVGSISIRLHDYKSAEESLLEAVKLSEKCRSEILLIDGLGTLGSLYVRLAKYESAKDVSKRALDLVIASANRDSILYQYGEAVASENLGIITMWQGENTVAMRHFRRAVELFGKLDKVTGGYRPEVLDNLMNIGRLYYDLGDYRQALGYFSDVLLASEKSNYRSRQYGVLNDLGLLYMDQADYETATQQFTRSLKIGKEAGDPDAIMAATCNLGVTSERQGKYKTAGDFFNKCMVLAERESAPQYLIPAMEGLATVLGRQGLHKQALDEYDKAMHVATKLGDKLRESELSWWKAGVYYDLRDYGKSLDLAREAERLAEEIQETNYSYLALTLVGKSYLALGKYDAAKDSLARAIEKAEQIRGQVGGQEEQRAFFFERKIEPYYLMVDLLARQNRTEDALEFAERARGRALLDLIGGAKLDIARSMSPAEREEERRLNDQLSDLNRKLYREYQLADRTKDRGRELKISLEKARVDYDSFIDRLYVTHPELRTDRGEAAPFTLKDVRTLLPSPNAAVVEFEVLDQKVCVFMLTLESRGNILVKTYSVPITRKDLTKRVEVLRGHLMDGSLSYDGESVKLFQLLFGNAAPALKEKGTLILVPDDVLWEVPFQALKDSDGHYLIEKHAIFYAPSLTVLREMRQRESDRSAKGVEPQLAGNGGPSSQLSLLAFGDPTISAQSRKPSDITLRNEEFLPMPIARVEVETLRRLYGATNTEVYVGARATEERAKAEMSRFRILHFATHGVLEETNPLYSYVALSRAATDSSEDGFLEAREIMGMNLNADLAVLSACATAGGRISRGEGVIGMSWALFVAGCPRSIVSQWKVEANSTATLMIDFHRALLSMNKGSRHVYGTAEALRQAALKMLRTPGLDLPVYWAGFIVIGDGW